MQRPAFLAFLVIFCFVQLVRADTVDIESSAAWRATATSPPAGWDTQIGFDDSDAAGWQQAFKSPSGNHIWITSNLSSESPNQAWFRFVFDLPSSVTAAAGTFYFDDNGEAYINGQNVVTDGGGGATTVDLPTLDTSLFHVGQNLIAVHGIDTIAPFSNIGVSLNLTVVPEPAVLGLTVVGSILLLRRLRRA